MRADHGRAMLTVCLACGLGHVRVIYLGNGEWQLLDGTAN